MSIKKQRGATHPWLISLDGNLHPLHVVLLLGDLDALHLTEVGQHGELQPYNNTFNISSQHATECNTECRNTEGAY